MVFAVWWVGTNLGQPRAMQKSSIATPENVIIPEKANESKGLLRKVVSFQTLERTGFFGAEGA
jgi:hypothetical protein